jgi:hypothetical protein
MKLTKQEEKTLKELLEKKAQSEAVIQEIPAKTIEWGAESDKPMTWDEAVKWCEDQGGRLPTVTELLEAYIDEDIRETFCQSNNYWSSTETNSNFARNVYFYNGNASSSYKDNNYYVRCVR